MNRNQLVILSAAAGAAAAVAWGVALLQDTTERGNESLAEPTVGSTASQPASVEPEAPQSTVPTDLRVPTIEPGRGGTPRGGKPRDVASSLSGIAAAFVRTMWMYDTAIDTTSYDAAARAARWATDPLASALARPATRTTPQWDEWLRHEAFTRVGIAQVPILGQDVRTAERLRTYRVDVLAVGADGYRDQLEPFLVTCTLVREDGLWLVDGITLP